MIYIYPEDYTIIENPPKDEMSPQLRSAIKTRMKNYVIDQNRPIMIKELLDLAQDRLISEHGKHIHDKILRKIALEIRDEWGVPSGV